ncbi:SSI family serine proteinase inhibitor [Spirillospora albida]|uniref:SSI family serine proteinase inhibitor n=1 Tax=Spirillospora albida TaxID=58123 RepID=UPI0004C0C98E|nr:SSI family serine proteinase inhibitor [Spirillospora albida]
MRFLATIAAVLATCLIVPIAAHSAQAAHTRHDRMRLTLTYPESDTSAPRTITLFCDPPHGPHPRAASACADLERGQGLIDHEPDDRMCAAVYTPVVARAHGQWHGRQIRFRGEYGNSCVLHSRTGAIFDF